jgi:hypothetical protein
LHRRIVSKVKLRTSTITKFYFRALQGTLVNWRKPRGSGPRAETSEDVEDVKSDDHHERNAEKPKKHWHWLPPIFVMKPAI